MIPQFRHHVLGERTDNHVDREGSNKSCELLFPVSEIQFAFCLKYGMDSLALKSTKQKI